MAPSVIRKPQIPARVGLSLSAFMICVASLTFVSLPFGDVSEWPALTTIRDKRSPLNILSFRAEQASPWLYKGGKGAAAILWSILIPLQHNQGIRQRMPKFHRQAGYTIILLSIELALAGYYMAARQMVTTHANFFHIHTLYGTYIPIPLFSWPTFNFAIVILGVFYFISLFKLFTAIRAKKVESHRRWAVFHSMTGYAIAIERVFTVAVLSLGWALHALPPPFRRMLSVPRNIEDKIDVEVAALAWTLMAAGVVVGVWAYREFYNKGLASGSGNGRLEAEKTK